MFNTFISKLNFSKQMSKEKIEQKDSKQLFLDIEIANIVNFIKELKIIVKFLFKALNQKEKYFKDSILQSKLPIGLNNNQTELTDFNSL